MYLKEFLKDIIKKNRKMRRTLDQNTGYERTNADGDIKKKDKKVTVDPITGDKMTTITRTKVERANSRSSSSSSSGGGVGIGKAKKSKHQYNNKVVNTPEGIETMVSEKHR